MVGTLFGVTNSEFILRWSQTKFLYTTLKSKWEQLQNYNHIPSGRTQICIPPQDKFTKYYLSILVRTMKLISLLLPPHSGVDNYSVLLNTNYDCLWLFIYGQCELAVLDIFLSISYQESILLFVKHRLLKDMWSC